MSESLLIDLHFLPSLEYFCALQDFNEIIIERHERFVKQSLRNRTFILTSQRVEMLTVPLAGKHNHILFRDVRIDHSKRWAPHMWRTILSAYRNAPFFEHYADDLEALLSKHHEFIYDLNQSALSFCLDALRWKKNISETSAFNVDIAPGSIDMRFQIDRPERFSSRDLYTAAPYYQVFGTDFSPNLSLIDLLFCKGPEAGEILLNSRGNRLNK
jgi:hypothetical protein